MVEFFIENKMNIERTFTTNIVNKKTLEIVAPQMNLHRSGKKSFKFDHIFDRNSSQGEVFSEIKPIIQSAVIQGHNVCIFAYGQTASGKTYLMQGGHSTETEGLIQRTVRTY